MLKLLFLNLFVFYVLAYQKVGILGGNDAVDGQIPYQVSIQYCDIFGCRHVCGGSVIDKRWILTAGHCYSYGSDIRILAGTVKLSKKDNYTQQIKVQKSYVYEDYRGNANPNDICLMELEEDLLYNDRIQPIPLPDVESEITGPSNTSGWGYVTDDLFPKLPDNLQWLEMNILSGEECKEALDKAFQGNRNPFDIQANICAENHEGTHTICKGDSGSPMVHDGKIIGLSSWGLVPCSRKESPPVFTKISHYIDWINSITQTSY